MIKKIIISALVLAVIGAIAYWYIFNDKFSDTTEREAAFKVSALSFINEFVQNDTATSKKYADKIVEVSGRVSELEAADTTINVKMTDTLTGSYVIFDFQSQHAAEAKQLHIGDSVTIKGSCSGSVYSKILKAHFISFKRSALVK